MSWLEIRVEGAGNLGSLNFGILSVDLFKDKEDDTAWLVFIIDKDDKSSPGRGFNRLFVLLDRVGDLFMKIIII